MLELLVFGKSKPSFLIFAKSVFKVSFKTAFVMQCVQEHFLCVLFCELFVQCEGVCFRAKLQ